MKNEPQRVEHPFEPVWDKNCEIMILGSLPSVKSREVQFYYGHPKNRFWQVLAAVYDARVPVTTEEKKAFLLDHRIALWDVAASCEISASSDSSIKNVTVNDICPLIERNNIDRIFTNGATADKLYEKYIFPLTGIRSVKLPSTSPANAEWSAERLVKEWSSAIKRKGFE